jgi:hypothetical protein
MLGDVVELGAAELYGGHGVVGYAEHALIGGVNLVV